MFDFDELDGCDESKHAEDTPSASTATPTQPPPLGRKIRILGLHGGGANSNVMAYQVANLKRCLGDCAEWHFLNGGRPWTFDNPGGPGEIMSALAKGMPFCGWYGVTTTDQSDRPYSDKLFDPSVKFTYDEVDVAVDRVMRYFETNGPFDILVCFSQGTIINHLVAATLRDRGQALPWRLSVLMCGMQVRDERYSSLFEKPLNLPAVMVFGKQDEMYEYGRSSQIALYKDPVVLDHEEGHKFPSRGAKGDAIYSRLVREMRWHCGLSV